MLQHIPAGTNIFRDPVVRETVNELIDTVARLRSELDAMRAGRIDGEEGTRFIPVRLTADGSATGYFEFQEVVYNPSSGEWEDVSGGLTHSELGEAYCTGGVVDSGMAAVFLGVVVYLSNRGMVNDDGTAIFEFDAPPTVMPVDVSQVGGSQGTDSTAATWTYDVTAEDGATLLSGVSPQNQRPTAGEVKAASHGYVHYELVGGTPTLTLGWVNEVPDPSTSDNKGYTTLKDEDANTVSETDDGVIEFAGPITMALIPVHNSVHEGDGTDTVRLWVDPDDLPTGDGFPSATEVTVVTDVRVDSSTKKLQYKNRDVWVLAADAESGWTDFHTGVECS
jgi:hypothetical protein